MPVSDVSSADVLEILAPIWHVKPDMAGKLRQHMRAVLEWAVAMELRIDNPCDRVGPVLGPQHKVVQHMRALPHRKVGAAIQAVRASTGAPGVKLAFEFLVLTAARWGEVRWAEWSEIDGRGCVDPPERTKAAGTGCRCVAAPWRSRGDARSQSIEGGRSSCAGCSGSDRGRAARVPVSGTGQPRKRTIPARSGGPGARGPEQGLALGPVRAPAPAHGRLGRLPGRPGQLIRRGARRGQRGRRRNA